MERGSGDSMLSENLFGWDCSGNRPNCFQVDELVGSKNGQDLVLQESKQSVTICAYLYVLSSLVRHERVTFRDNLQTLLFGQLLLSRR